MESLQKGISHWINYFRGCLYFRKLSKGVVPQFSLNAFFFQEHSVNLGLRIFLDAIFQFWVDTTGILSWDYK